MRQWRTTGNNVATQTGSTYTTRTATNSVEIPMASPGFLTMASLNKVSPSDCNNDRQLEMVMSPTKPEISGTMTDRVTIPTANLGFRPRPARWNWSQTTATTTETGNGNIDVCSPIIQFLVVDRCCNHLANLLSSWISSKIRNLALEFRRYLSQFHRCNYFWFWRPCRYFRTSYVWSYTPDLSLEV